MEIEELRRIVAAGESETVEFKKSTGLLNRAGETLCAFLNAQGGRVFIGVTPGGQVVGQHVSDNTQRDVAAMLSRFEPAATVEVGRIRLPNGHEVLMLEAKPTAQAMPFVFAGKPYQRIGSTTSVMPQARYQALLLERSHDRSRWENVPADGFDLAQLDQEEILRTVRLGIEKRRLPESTGTNIGDILDRFGLRENGRILNAAVVLFGKDVFPAHPQCYLRLARFRGADKTEFLDERQLPGNAFHLLNEAMLFLDRHLPISGRIEPGKLERIDELLFPPDALREALVNGLCHRDYSIVGGAINVAVFDDRVEIWSDGKLPFGLHPGDLKRQHASKPRNPLITGVFYRCGLIEQWGRGTQRIIELCRKAGHPDPEFEEIADSVVVTFRPASGSITPQVTTEVTTEVTMEVAKLLPMCVKPRSKTALREEAGLRNDEHFRKAYLIPALAAGLIEMTIPDKPNSRLQQYRLTAKGQAWLAQHAK